MDNTLNYFLDKVKNKYWIKGSNWEFDWYIDCFFVEVMAYGDYPVSLKYEQPILGDQFLQVDPVIEKEIISRFSGIFSKPRQIGDLLNKQSAINNSATDLLTEIEISGKIDLHDYEKVQKDLSLLMASVSLVFDKLVGEDVSRISLEEDIEDELLTRYILEKTTPTALSRSNIDLNRIYKKHKNDINNSGFIYQKLAKTAQSDMYHHTAKYGWINTGERGGQEWTAIDFLSQIQDLTRNNNEKQLSTGRLAITNNNKQVLDSIVVLNSNDNQASDLQIKLDFLFQKYLKTKLDKYYLPEIIENLTYNEITNLIQNPVTITNFSDRANNHNRLVYPTQDKLNYYYFDNDQDFAKTVKLVDESSSSPKVTITGRPACSGKATGVVRIIKTKDDLLLMKNGEIMIAVKTQPSYLFAMKKAAAIVTDIGGITSHAAIIAREFNIPCIAGTGNATSLLKNGDRVLVNADIGEVTIIKRL